MDTLVADTHDRFYHQEAQGRNVIMHQLPFQTISPSINGINRRRRLEPLTIQEYEANYRQSATDLELVERVFFGGIACNQLREALWPYLFGLMPERGRFDKIQNLDGKEAFVYIEPEANTKKWAELQKLFKSYQDQWRNILPDQETRFSTFRERKLLIEPDVIRCDRLHPFYAEESQNLAKLTCLLMTYMMYDFDIGYVQGMSDLAGPILYVYNGDTLKAFWIFVEVMKLFRRNFELSQKTIQYQLSCLFEVIKVSDPVFAQYLRDHDSSNCFFAFRPIVCQFKRELMKDVKDQYRNVLLLWDTTWFAWRRNDLLNKEGFHQHLHHGNHLHLNNFQHPQSHHLKSSTAPQAHLPRTIPVTTSNRNSKDRTRGLYDDQLFYMPFDTNQADTPRVKLTETEIFVLALCLSIIRRERDLIMAKRLDGTEIHLHFSNSKVTCLSGFIEQAIDIYSYLKYDLDINKLTSRSRANTRFLEESVETPIGSADLLRDFIIINGASSPGYS